MPSQVELNDVRKGFGDRQIIKGIDLAIQPSEFIVLVGPSGCGKSTLLRMIAGLESVDAGEIRFDGVVVNDRTPAERNVGMVFQSYALYPHMTVAENVGFALKLARIDPHERQRRVDAVLESLQLSALRDARPSQLSGGQRQRVAIGRSIVRNPAVFLFDEPLSNLDTALRVQMRLEISRLHNRLRNTVVYVTHDQVEAMTLADRIVVLEAGTVQQIGAPLELYERPANRFVAGFLGSPQMGFLPAQALGLNGNALAVRIAASGQVLAFPHHGAHAGAVTIGIRPEDCTLCAPEDGHFAGAVLQVERLGSDTFAFVESTGTEPVAVRVGAGHTVAAGHAVGITFDPARAHLFASDGVTLPRLAA
ncbi:MULTISPECIES: ABC transporter ATP-binding protein [unclassified Novosphingobium]|uniref:ABC transporter ATP-binding protein n=1 Tax=unclassified Novosphingobium TaxID=2644732 RepID=UPI00146E6FA1|nr:MULTISPECIES: ABC transporter ATP-binding protein [unclassified Novosphingobium]NMN05043.1 multiple sugar transport system ATP-binding protein [Novosphingobium sp. SG919]NMN87337.1 multiple sugar transport system ATP-binding protein [Novosphingobium sp. SG916]